MYTPRLFHETDAARIRALIDGCPFGLLVVPGPSGAELAHAPFLLDRDEGPHGRLRLHLARANPAARAALLGGPVVAVFQGPHGYVSASWYEKPHEQVPTWNYAVVHAHGRAAAMDRDGLRTLLGDLAARFEDAAAPWTPGRVDPREMDAMLGEIVGFSIRVERVEAKSKLSQNRSAEDRRRVVAALAARGTPDDLEMVRLMTGGASSSG